MTIFWLESAEFDQPFPFNYAILMSQDLDFNEPANTHKNVFGKVIFYVFGSENLQISVCFFIKSEIIWRGKSVILQIFHKNL